MALDMRMEILTRMGIWMEMERDMEIGMRM